jgi:large subunit ribosomal protein L35
MNKPIYRHLANLKWREYSRPVVVQRITQMNVIPDVLPTIDPIASVELAFDGFNVQPGEFVQSRRSELPPTLRVQVFDSGPRLVTVVVVDSDVPNVEEDRFNYRCHGIYSNIEISPSNGKIALKQLSEGNTELLSWMPPFSQQGAPYHRLSVWILQQPDGKTLDTDSAKSVKRDHFLLRSFVDANSLTPTGVTMFRTQWDESTADIMNRHGIPGADIAFKRKKIEPLPYKKKDGSRYR